MGLYFPSAIIGTVIGIDHGFCLTDQDIFPQGCNLAVVRKFCPAIKDHCTL